MVIETLLGNWIAHSLKKILWYWSGRQLLTTEYIKSFEKNMT